MERRRWSRRTAWGGGIATGTGIVLFVLFSDAGGSCTANVIVLSDGVIGPHGCAASSIAYHAGIGLMVLGAALLVGACVLAVVGRTEEVVVTNGTITHRSVSAPPTVEQPGPESTRAAGEAERREDRGPEEVVALPPGWYGNPSNPNGSVQWWDGRRLVDRPPPGGP